MKNRATAISYLKLIFWGALVVGIVFFISAVLISCKKKAEDPIPVIVAPPTISGVSPSSGITPNGGVSGTLITISGSNFSTTASENEIKFNGTTATANSATTTQLTTSVPAGATTGKITVTVNGQTATSAVDFVVLQLPTITSFSPASGVVGTTVIITGTNFDAIPASNTVKFNNTTAVVSAATTTQLTTTVPVTATTGKITVAVNGQTTTSATDFTILFQPTITSFAPVYALPGATVTVTGINFSTTPANNAVTINGAAAAVTTASATQLTVSVPANATTGKIAVTSTTLTATSTNDFEVLKDIPRTGLIAYYPFTGNGTCSNNSLLNLPIADTNQPTLTADRYGKSDQALNFNGTQSSLISQQVIPNRPWTISVWMDPGLFNNTIMGFMASHSGTSGIVFQFRNVSSGDFYIVGFGQNTTGDYSFVETLPATRYIPGDGIESKWFLLTMTYNGSVFKIHKDNIEVYSANSAFETPTENHFELGSSGIYNFSNYIGKMDDLLIYDRALTPQELTQLFQQTVSKY